MSIRTKILLSLAFTILLAVGGTSGIAFYQSKQVTIQNFEVNAQAQMDRMDEYMNLLLESMGSILNTVTQSKIVREGATVPTTYLHMTSDFTPNSASFGPEEKILYDELTTFRNIFPSVGIVFVAMENGGITESPDVGLSAAYDPRTRMWYKNSKSNPKESVLSEVYMSTSGSPTFTMTKGIYDTENKFIGVGALDFHISDITEKMADIAIGTTGHTIITEPYGTIIIDKDNAQRLFKKTSDVNLPELDSLFAKGEGMGYVTIDNVSHYAAVHTTKDNWRIMMLIEESELTAAGTQAALKSLSFGIILGVIIMIIGFFIAQSIASPIVQLAETSQKVALGNMEAMNNLPTFKGELFDLQSSMQKMIGQLGKTLHEANEQTQQATKALAIAKQATDEAKEAQIQAEKAKKEGTLYAAQQLEGIGQHLSVATHSLLQQVTIASNGATEQDSKVNITVRDMEQLNHMITEVNTNTQQAFTMSAQTKEKANESKAVIMEAIKEINNVQKESQELKADMDFLATQAQAINQVMNVIVDIADQTNLLALNAAIEAARAGDAGRGFAVVADEVRKLAEKTTQSTSEVGNSIRTIQQSTQRSMQQVDKTNQNIEKATTLVQKSGVDLEEILHYADGTADKIQFISSTSDEQAKASQVINNALSDVSSIATKTKEIMQDSTQLLTQLNKQSTELTSLISQLKNN